MQKFLIQIEPKYIVIKTNEILNQNNMLLIETAFLFVKTEYDKLPYIMNKENRVLEAKYNAIELMQSDCESKEEEKACDVICQYIINLEFENI
jgi:hypothetical protein